MSADDEKRDARAVDDALLRAFCAVQALCAGAIGVAYPAVVCALATWIFIFTGIVVARELTEKHIPDEARRRRVFGGCWAALWHLWLPCCLLNRWGYFSFHFPSFVYGSGTLLWMLLSFYQRLLGLPGAARASADAVIVLGMFLKPPWSPLGQPAEGLLIACGVLLGELLGFTWAAHQARARNQSKEQAARLLNHAAKRVISNSAQASPARAEIKSRAARAADAMARRYPHSQVATGPGPARRPDLRRRGHAPARARRGRGFVTDAVVLVRHWVSLVPASSPREGAHPVFQ